MKSDEKVHRQMHAENLPFANVSQRFQIGHAAAGAADVAVGAVAGDAAGYAVVDAAVYAVGDAAVAADVAGAPEDAIADEVAGGFVDVAADASVATVLKKQISFLITIYQLPLQKNTLR